jgi:SAM-dependent methyltransferase
VKEPLLEPLLRRLRLRRVYPVIARYPGCRLLDVGCGWEARLLKGIGPRLELGIGIDRKAPVIDDGRIRTLQCDLEAPLPFSPDSFDVVTMLAVLEHLERAMDVLAEVHRVLKSGGSLVLTVPSHAAKPVLEFLAFRLGVVSPEEIADHKRYWNRPELAAAATQSGFELAAHEYFQLGFNNFAVFRKARS